MCLYGIIPEITRTIPFCYGSIEENSGSSGMPLHDGQYDLFIKIYAKNNQHLLNIIHNKLQPLGLARTESLISFKEAFKRQIPIDLDDE